MRCRKNPEDSGGFYSEISLDCGCYLIIRAPYGKFLFLVEIERRVDAAERLKRRIGNPSLRRACDAKKCQSIFCYLKLLIAVGGRDSEGTPSRGRGPISIVASFHPLGRSGAETRMIGVCLSRNTPMLRLCPRSKENGAPLEAARRVLPVGTSRGARVTVSGRGSVSRTRVSLPSRRYSAAAAMPSRSCSILRMT